MWSLGSSACIVTEENIRLFLRVIRVTRPVFYSIGVQGERGCKIGVQGERGCKIGVHGEWGCKIGVHGERGCKIGVQGERGYSSFPQSYRTSSVTRPVFYSVGVQGERGCKIGVQGERGCKMLFMWVC